MPRLGLCLALPAVLGFASRPRLGATPQLDVTARGDEIDSQTIAAVFAPLFDARSTRSAGGGLPQPMNVSLHLRTEPGRDSRDSTSNTAADHARSFYADPPPVSDWDAQVSYMGVGELASAFDLDLNGAEVKDTPTDEDDVVLASIGLAGSAIMPPRLMACKRVLDPNAASCEPVDLHEPAGLDADTPGPGRRLGLVTTFFGVLISAGAEISLWEMFGGAAGMDDWIHNNYKKCVGADGPTNGISCCATGAWAYAVWFRPCCDNPTDAYKASYGYNSAGLAAGVKLPGYGYGVEGFKQRAGRNGGLCHSGPLSEWDSHLCGTEDSDVTGADGGYCTAPSEMNWNPPDEVKSLIYPNPAKQNLRFPCDRACAQACHPAGSLLELANGDKVAIADAAVGDLLKTPALGPQPILGFVHAEDNDAMYMCLSTPSASLTISPGHHTFVNGTETEPSKVKVGDLLHTPHGLERVTHVEWTAGKGAYHIIVRGGSYYVDGILASDYFDLVPRPVFSLFRAYVDARFRLGVPVVPLGKGLIDHDWPYRLLAWLLPGGNEHHFWPLSCSLGLLTEVANAVVDSHFPTSALGVLTTIAVLAAWNTIRKARALAK